MVFISLPLLYAYQAKRSLDAYDNCEITELEPWDPMGSLAM